LVMKILKELSQKASMGLVMLKYGIKELIESLKKVLQKESSKYQGTSFRENTDLSN